MIQQQYSTPCRMTVDPGRKALRVTNWGRAPFHLTKTGAWVPHEFEVETMYKKRLFIARALVTSSSGGNGDNDGELSSTFVMYQFSTWAGGVGGDKGVLIDGEVGKTPTAALGFIVDKLLREGAMARHKRGASGCIHIGVTYPSIQQALREIHSLLDWTSTPVVAAGGGGEQDKVAEEAEEADYSMDDDDVDAMFNEMLDSLLE